MTALRLRHERFALRRVVEAESAAATYRVLYPKARKASSWAAASRLLRNGNVARRIDELRQQVAKRHQRTIDHIADELDQSYALAHRLGQAGAAVSASMAKAKLYGLIVNKHETVQRSGDPLTMLIEELGSEQAALQALDAMREELVKRIDANRD
jgi:hypothetical protein